ncbi:MAG TPA: hypothetical protein VJH05_00020 [Candidatus Paceibacterota bacterium]
MSKYFFYSASIIVFAVFFPFFAGATHLIDKPAFDSLGAWTDIAQGKCNYSLSDSRTFSDEPYRLFYSLSTGGIVERDDTWAAHITINGVSEQLYTYGNCRCSNDPESGCPYKDNVYWLSVFQDSGAETSDTVTITGDVNNKAGNVTGFKGYQTMATWRLCDEKQVTNNGTCKTISGNIQSDKISCIGSCGPTISYTTEFAQNPVVKKDGQVWQNGTTLTNTSIDNIETHNFILYGTASDGNNTSKEFELGRVTVTVRPENAPFCQQDLYSTTVNSLITIQEKSGNSVNWSAPGGTPSQSTSPSSSFSTSYTSTGEKTVTLSNGSSLGTCSINVTPSIQLGTSGIDIKADGQDSLTIPSTKSNFILSWSPSPSEGTLTNCFSTGDWLNKSRPSSASNVAISTVGITGTKTYGIECLNEIGETVSDSVLVTVTGDSGQQSETCSLEASSDWVNPGQEVSFIIGSNPNNFSFYWTGTNNGISMSQVEGTGNTTRIEKHKFNNVGSTYVRQAHVRLPNGTCHTNSVTVDVVEPDGGSGRGGVGGATKYYGCSGATDTNFGQGTGCAEYSSYINPTRTPYSGSAGRDICMLNCAPGEVEIEIPPPPPLAVNLKAATDGNVDFGGNWKTALQGFKPVLNVDLWASPGNQVVYSDVVAYHFDCSSDGSIEMTVPITPWWRGGNGQGVAVNLCDYKNTGTFTATAIALGNAFGASYCGWSGNYYTPWPCREIDRGTVEIQVDPLPQNFTMTDILWTIQSGTPRYRADYDYNTDGKLDKSDRDILATRISGLGGGQANFCSEYMAAPGVKTCDVNKNGVVNVGDTLVYTFYLRTLDIQIGSLGARNAKANVYMTSNAGATVNLTSNAPFGHLIVPSSVSVPAGSTVASAELRLPILNILRNYSITLTGLAGGGTTRTSNPLTLNVIGASRPLSVPDFALNKNRDIFVNIVGTQAVTSNTAKITVGVFDGFSSNVNLSVQSVSPAISGATFNFSDASLTPSEFTTGSDFSVTVPASTAPGVYTITVRGADGGFVRDVNVRLNVNTRDPSFREI